MRCQAWWTAAGVTVAFAFAILLLEHLAFGHFAWGAPEKPKAQGEALVKSARLVDDMNGEASHYRKTVAAALVREPQNTWSNLAFVLIGVAILALDHRIWAIFFGAALTILGAASGLYHTSLLPFWRSFDVAMMGCTLAALVALGATLFEEKRHSRLGRFLQKPSVQVFIGGVGGSCVILTAVWRNEIRVAGIKPFDSTYTTVFGLIVVVGLVIRGLFWSGGQKIRLPATLLGALTLAGVLCQLGDHPNRPLFNPDASVQAHAVWHCPDGRRRRSRLRYFLADR